MPTQVVAGLQQETGKALMNAVMLGYGKGFEQIDYQSPDNEMIAYLQNNMYAFSAAKTFTQIQELQKLLIDPETKLPLSFQKFKDAAQKIHQQYNIAYLYAEYNHAIAAAQMAANWLRIEQDKEDLPYLQYTTAGDARVRTEHAALNGVVLPVNSGFWNTYYPPNGWNCRCDAIQLTQDQAEKIGVTNETQAIGMAKNATTQELFELNVGKQKVVFDTNKHPYFTQIQGSPTELSAATNYGMKTIGQIYKNAAQLPAMPQSIIASYADLLAWWKQNADANNNIVVRTGVQTIILDQKLLSHMGQSKQRSENRFAYINEVIAAIRQPNEVWQHFYSPSAASSKKQTLTTTFIKYFRSNPTSKNQSILLIKAELINGAITVKTFYTAKATDAVGSKHRKGILLKKQ